MKNLLIAFLLGTTLVLGFLYLQPAPQLGANPSNEFLKPVVFHDEITLNNCGTATWNPGSLASSSVDGVSATTTNVTVTGLALGDSCIGSLSSATSTAALFSCNVSAANTGTVTLINTGSVALDLATGTAKVCYFD